MTIDRLRIATRESPLALWQAEHVASRLRAAYPDLTIDLVGMTTRGDEIQNTPLSRIGGKGLFVKALEQAMMDGHADIAVHSMKDVPAEAEMPEGFHVAVIMAREDPRDAFVSNDYADIDALPDGARVGTCSLRRRCQLAERRPDLRIVDLRGNVNTRLAKLDRGDFDAIILAGAGLKRLGMTDRIRRLLPTTTSLPAAGQGAIGIECRSDDRALFGLLTALHHPVTAAVVGAERAVSARLQGGCQVPLAAYGEADGARLTLNALVGEPDGSVILRASGEGPLDEGGELGHRLAEDLLAQGADAILRRLATHTP